MDDIIRIITESKFEKLDPRIYSCLACATLSCPDIKNYAYTEDQIYSQMDRSVSEWLADEEKGIQIVAADSLLISPLLETYKTEILNISYPRCFDAYNGEEVVAFLSKHGPEEVKELINKVPCPNLWTFAYDNRLNGDITHLCEANRTCCPLWAIITAVMSVLALVTVVLAFVGKKVMDKRKQDQVVDKDRLLVN
eukprot:TRINITY_DN3210_c0_g1_i2.p1 TRINITY_DN3210_c0_g1~~TRINITY_DN3210_c0_g1_i2.p1  ORF type:complete len:195 (+),score=25.53 TRINITY_DN3210_c0_g1_i2:648-1232(+)